MFFFLPRVIYKLLASKSESIRVQALKVLGYFLKHLGHKWEASHVLVLGQDLGAEVLVFIWM